jgi:citrate synthase
MDQQKENDKKATLALPNGKKISLEVKYPTLGYPAINISSLLKNTGYLMHDPGFRNTSACDSEITYINGKEGILLHRGKNIKILAQQNKYLEVSHLLIYGELPDKSQFVGFDNSIKKEMSILDGLACILQAFPDDAHPMAILKATTALLSGLHHDRIESDPLGNIDYITHILFAQMPILAANIYRYNNGRDMIEPRKDLGYIDNFLYMLLDERHTPYKSSKALVEAMEKIFILHADHEQNASTSTVRFAASTGANIFACIDAGMSSLWGPSHGGANEAVINMLKEIKNISEINGNKNITIDDKISYFIKKVKAKKAKLMGFGHAVYTNYDPRAQALQEACEEVLKELNSGSDLLEIAEKLKEAALNDEYFQSRSLYPNVDFYSGIIYQALGIDENFYTVIFAIARISGWVAHIRESLLQKSKIGRPRQLYTGEIPK